MPRPERPLGEVVYEGPSELNQEPIVVVLGLRPTGNRKVGERLLQTWILSQSAEPVPAAKEGMDAAVCGDCALRPKLRREDREAGRPKLFRRGCYVNLFWAPTAIYRSWKAGKYATTPQRIPAWALLRMGSYGDPSAVPIDVWRDLVSRVRKATKIPEPKPVSLGYTRQWKLKPEMSEFYMASVFSEEEARQARKLGFRTFRIRPDVGALVRMMGTGGLMANEFECPASEEQSHRLNCQDCMACDGSRGDSDRRASPVIINH